MAQYHKLVCLVAVTLTAVYGSKALDSAVSNRAESSIGSKRFNQEVGADYAKQTLASAADFIQKMFPQEGKEVQKVSMVVENIDGVAYASEEEIHVSAGYIERYPGDIKEEIAGILHHEMAHVLLWDANGQAPSGLLEGIADFVRLKAGYPAGNWVPPGRGDDWFQGYDVTARFLDYCNTIRDGFVADLNARMKTSYSDSYFTDLLGKPLPQLWIDYKTKYAAIN